MSLNQKYTWKDFLKEHPEHKEKKTKRTSAEGKKTFDAACKSFIKKYLATRSEKIGKEMEHALKCHDTLMLKVKELCKAKKFPCARLVQRNAGRQASAIARFKKQLEKTKALQKS